MSSVRNHVAGVLTASEHILAAVTLSWPIATRAAFDASRITIADDSREVSLLVNEVCDHGKVRLTTIKNPPQTAYAFGGHEALRERVHTASGSCVA